MVVVRCVVDVKGQPKQVVVSRSLSRAFDKNAVHAVEQFRFEPAEFEGKAVPVEVNIEVNSNATDHRPGDKVFFTRDIVAVQRCLHFVGAEFLQ